MANYRLAQLTPEMMAAVERLENDLHVTLVAYEPGRATTEFSSELANVDDETLDALVDTYRSYDPQG